MNLLPIDSFHILIGLACGVSCTLIVGKGRIFMPLRAKVALCSKTRQWLGPFSEMLHCQQCLGFWVGLLTGLALFNLLWALLFAWLVSLLAVWNDFALQALNRIGTTPTIPQHPWMYQALDTKINGDAEMQVQMNTSE